jgi:hypothetical protein
MKNVPAYCVIFTTIEREKNPGYILKLEEGANRGECGVKGRKGNRVYEGHSGQG